MLSIADFERFVDATSYETNAERIGWSFVQLDVNTHKLEEDANWRKPDGFSAPSSTKLPVTHVSYNDAEAYCKWAGKRLPNYEEYWELRNSDKRPLLINYLSPISPAEEVNIRGNVWELTASPQKDSIRLAGGSIFCAPKICNGTSKERSLWVDDETANIHIGFALIDR